MSILNEKIKFNDTPFWEKSFGLESKTDGEYIAESDALLKEIKETVAVVPFFKDRNADKLSDFIHLASAVANFAMLEGADLYMYTDDKDNVIIYTVAPSFYLRRSAMISLAKICLLAFETAISTPENAEECVISFGFDFSRDGKSAIDALKEMF